MPIYNDHKAFHLHIPKCAGTFIEQRLGLPTGDVVWTDLKYMKEEYLYGPIDANGEDNGYYQHLTMDEIRADYSDLFEGVLEGYFVFTFVRNPYDRLASEYFYLKKRSDRNLGDLTFRDFCLNLDSAWPKYIADHLTPQSIYFDSTDVDFVGRMEDFSAGWEYVQDRLGLKKSDWEEPKVNTSEREASTTSLFDPNMRRVVRDFYEEDFERFKYSLDL